ncbi:MAG: flavoprotein [Endomicrobiia bacterium]
MKKNILLGLTAGVAIYKVCELVRILKKKGYNIKCIMTKDATKLISPLLVEQLSENQVYIDMFEKYDYSTIHTSLSEWANLVLVVPCSCNTLAKLSCGKTEDLLSCTIYACDFKKTKVILCPSMNTNMWLHPITQKNIKLLKEIGYEIIQPESGELLCGKSGIGRLPEIKKIVSYVEKILKK